LALADLTSAAFAMAACGALSSQHALLASAAVLPVWVVFAKLLDLYDRDRRSLRHQTIDEWSLLVTWAFLSGTVWSLVAAPSFSGPRFLAVAGAAALVALPLRSVSRSVWRALTPPESAVVIGARLDAAVVEKKLDIFEDAHVRVVAVRTLDDVLTGSAESTWLPSTDRLIVIGEALEDGAVSQLLAASRRTQTKLSILPSMPDSYGAAAQLDHLGDLPVLEYTTWDISRSTLFLKRGLDLLVSVVALVLVAPILLVVTVAILVAHGRPVFYRQQRAGKDGKPFTMLKFRTMRQDADQMLAELLPAGLDEPMFKLQEDPRVTSIGRILRRWSLDELPQLINVLLGDMSLVGPRPEELWLVDRYEPDQRFRLLVKPGVTGPMQINGRARLDFGERLAVDRDYVDHLSLGRDLKILSMTLSAVLSGRGAW
jgi:exopolysaccharide biosynthesis polyprenyl glycosylphosphotransferase